MTESHDHVEELEGIGEVLARLHSLDLEPAEEATS